MKTDTQLYQRAAMIWSLALTLVFGAEVFFLLMILTGRQVFAGCVAAVVTTALVTLTCKVWRRLPEEEPVYHRGRGGEGPLPAYLVSRSLEHQQGGLRGLTGPDMPGSWEDSNDPWAEEVRAKERQPRSPRGNDFHRRFNF